MMKFKNSLFTCIGILLFWNVHLSITEEYKCHVPTNFKTSNKFQPLILDQGRFVYPEVNNTDIVLDYSVTHHNKPFLTLACAPGDHFLDNSETPSKVIDADYIELSCNTKRTASNMRYRMNMRRGSELNNIFRALRTRDEIVNVNTLSDIGCSEELIPKPVLDNFYCGILFSVCTSCIKIGFPYNIDYKAQIRIPKVIDLIAIEESKMLSFQARTYIPRAIGNRYVGNNSWPMKKGPVFEKFETIDIEEVYQKDYQRNAFFKIFQDQNLVDMYIPEAGNQYLTFGKLFTENDFFYDYQQKSIFYYENTMPVWNSVVTGNWEVAGEFLRKLIAKSHYDDNDVDMRFSGGVRVHSGNYETLQLPDQQGNLKKIFLARGPDGEPLFPVPKFLYKYASLDASKAANVSDNQLSDGLILVTVNNPYITKDALIKDYKLPCSSKVICQQVPEFEDLTKGYTYCCSLEEFQPIAKILNIQPYGILKYERNTFYLH